MKSVKEMGNYCSKYLVKWRLEMKMRMQPIRERDCCAFSLCHTNSPSSLLPAPGESLLLR